MFPKAESRQVKRIPQDCINESIIWKMKPLVVAATSLKVDLHSGMRNEQWMFHDNSSVFDKIEKTLNG